MKFSFLRSLLPFIVALLAATILVTSQPIQAMPAQNNHGGFDVHIPENTPDNINEEDEDWGDDWAEEEVTSPWQVTGIIEAAYGQFLQSNMTEKSSSLNEIRARINIDYSHSLFELAWKIDSRYDAVLDKKIWQTRELNVAASPFSFLDVKVGRQVLTWGTGDYLFLNDLFAKDWQSFFSGRADEYLKAPSDSIRTNWYFDNVNFTLVWTPEFTPDNYITGERFSFYSLQMQKIVAPRETFPVTKTNNSQWSARLNTSVNNIELSLYGYQGYWPTPQGGKATVENQAQGYFPKLNSWGFSALTTYAGGVINLEYSRYNSIEDRHGKNNNIANGQHRFLLGYERELAKNLTASVQYYLERTANYQALLENSTTPEQVVDENRQLITLRLTYRTQQQTLTYSLFSFYSPTDHDAYLKPSINYQYNDQWLFSAGANVFIGKDDYSFFGQHQDNTNTWLRLRYAY
ncbi:TonB-dependent receptor [Cognaticolwellia mytili]|uniref:hypothetical protein n=1 Tax=Cognaticolwellia mytili TaxID=1888913 RepID=UPI000A174892|nr:hypothetical protein [Cognaticolwellia mytili]